MKRIQSKSHQWGTYEVKETISCYNDKRYIIDDEIYFLTQAWRY